MPDYVDTLLRLVAQGKTLVEASKQVGIKRSWAHELVQRFGRDADRRTKRRITQPVKSRILELRGTGRSIASTARMLKVSRCSVRRHSRKPVDTFPRCPDCGGKTTVLPCPVCEARRLKGIK